MHVHWKYGGVGVAIYAMTLSCHTELDSVSTLLWIPAQSTE